MSGTKTKHRTVGEIMTRDPVCIDRTDTLREIARVFDDNDISGAPVVDVQGKVIGVISKTDVLHRAVVGPATEGPSSFFDRLADGLSDAGADSLGTAEDMMSSEPVTATEDEAIGRVAQRMASFRVHRVIVVDQANAPIGVVTTLDVLRDFPM